jgi:rod shape determining protein RodA
MREFLLHLKRMDWVLAVSAVLLVLIGLLFIFNSSNGLLNFKKQIIFFIIGLFLMLLFSFVDYRIFRENSYLILLIYLLSILALSGLFLFAPEIRGTKAWYKIFSISIDPIEFTKIALIILLAKYFSMRHVEMYSFKHIIFSGIYILIPSLLAFFQPNLGSVLILLSIWIIVLFISGIKIKQFSSLMMLFILILSLGWSFFLHDYQKDRISSFLFPDSNLLSMGWSQNQSKIAIGSGEILGKGIGNGSQSHYGFLPEAHTDFIFASIAEETGFVGVSILFLIYIVLINRLLNICSKSSSNFPRLLVVGFAALLVVQIFINVGMNLGILPVIGISLPFVSYGGSGLIALFLGLGIIESVVVHS